MNKLLQFPAVCSQSPAGIAEGANKGQPHLHAARENSDRRPPDPASAFSRAPISCVDQFQMRPVPYAERCQHGTVKTTEIISDAWSIGEVWALVDTITDDVLRRHGSRIASEIAEVSSELAGKWGIHGVSRPRVAAFLLIIKRDPVARAMFKQFFDGE